MRFGKSCFVALLLVAACGDDADDSEQDAAVDASTIDSGKDDGGTPDGGDGGGQAITLRFKAKVGSEDLVCGRTYPNVGTNRVSVTPQDFRFYVQEVRLINSRGAEVPLVFDERAPHQARDVALLDFTDGAGHCMSGEPTTNMVITGRAPADKYTGVVFVNGVPNSLNNASPSSAPAPLKMPGVHWSWTDGYRFTMAEVVAVSSATDGGMDSGAPWLGDAGHGESDAGHGESDAGSHGGHGGGFASFVHTGSTGCTGTPGSATGIVCAGADYRPNRAEVRLMNFDPTRNTIVADLAAVFAGVDPAKGTQCHGRGASCAPFFAPLGIDPNSGAPLTHQTVFKVE